MNRVVDKSDPRVAPALSTDGALPVPVKPGPRPLVKEGMWKGYDQGVIDELGLAKKDWVGVKPVELPPSPDDLRSFGRDMSAAAVRSFLRIFYDVDVQYKTDNVHSLVRGAMIAITPHTGLDDPMVNYSWLWPIFHAMPLSTEGMMTAPFFKRIMQAIHTAPVPDTSNPIGINDEVNELLARVVSGLHRGHNYGVHPAGEILRDGTETLGANSFLARVSELRPETPIIAAVPRGMNGTRFSRAGNFRDGEWHAPDLAGGISSAIGDIMHNYKGLFTGKNWSLKPVKMRVPVTIELHDITERFRAAKTVTEQNQILKDLAEQPDPETGKANQAWHTPYRYDDGERRPIASAERPKVESSKDVEPAELARITEDVLDHLQQLIGCKREELVPEAKLADLGLNSLQIVDGVQSFVNKTYDKQFASPEAFVTVDDVIGCATGRIPCTSGLEFKPVSDAFKAQALSDGLAKIPEGSVNVVDGFLRNVKAEPDRIIGVDEILGEVTNKQLATLVYMLLPTMREMKGDTVGLLFANSIMGTVVQLAANLAGKTPAMVNPQWSDDQALSAMKLAGVDSVLTAQAVIRALKGAREGQDAEAIAKGTKSAAEVEADRTRTTFPSLESRFSVVDDAMRDLSEWRMIDTKLRPGHVLGVLQSRATSLKPSDSAVILFTSGSTGNPKGIKYSHAKVLAGARALANRFELRRDDVLLHLAPSFHLVGYTAGIMATLVGVPTVNVPNPRAAAVAAKTGQLRQATITVATPTLMNVVAKAAGADGLASLKRVILGAEPLHENVADNIRSAAPGAALLQGYGATETGVTFTEVVEPGNPSDRSLGKPLDGIDYVIVQTDNPTKRVAPGESGLLLVTGPTVVTPEHGYVGKAPDDAFMTFEGKTYYYTGDIVRDHVIGDDTVVQFVDRASRFSKINGEIVPHGGLESVINTLLPETSDGTPKSIVVEGVANAGGAPTLVAYVVPGKSADGSPVDVNGAPLTYESVSNALMTAYKGDAKFNVAEIRLAQNIELLGTGKVNLSLYKKGAKLPYDGQTLVRGG